MTRRVGRGEPVAPTALPDLRLTVDRILPGPSGQRTAFGAPLALRPGVTGLAAAGIGENGHTALDAA